MRLTRRLHRIVLALLVALSLAVSATPADAGCRKTDCNSGAATTSRSSSPGWE